MTSILTLMISDIVWMILSWISCMQFRHTSLSEYALPWICSVVILDKPISPITLEMFLYFFHLNL